MHTQHHRQGTLQRDWNQCQHCAKPGNDWHHRRSRSVKDEHTNCSCNTVILCRECHSWAHAHPEKARELGLIISRYEERPWRVRMVTYFGKRWLDCDYGKTSFDPERFRTNV